MLNERQLCLIAIIIAGICAVHHWAYENRYMDMAPTQMVSHLYGLAGAITLYCAYKMAKMEGYIN